MSQNPPVSMANFFQDPENRKNIFPLNQRIEFDDFEIVLEEAYIDPDMTIIKYKTKNSGGGICFIKWAALENDSFFLKFHHTVFNAAGDDEKGPFQCISFSGIPGGLDLEGFNLWIGAMEALEPKSASRDEEEPQIYYAIDRRVGDKLTPDELSQEKAVFSRMAGRICRGNAGDWLTFIDKSFPIKAPVRKTSLLPGQGVYRVKNTAASAFKPGGTEESLAKNLSSRSRFTVHVPATSANLGPGYDVLGMAVEVFNKFHFTIVDGEKGTPGKVTVEVRGEGSGELPANENNLVYRAFAAGCRRAGAEAPEVHIVQENAVPLNRGMGSSATAALGGLMAAQRISGGQLDDESLVSMAVEMEGHPDNLMAAYLGGVVINYERDGGYHGAKFIPAKPLRAILVIPEIQVSTQKARKLLPGSYPISDVVAGLRNISLLIFALQSGRYEFLGEAMGDRIHQPYRAELIPGFYDAVRAAKDTGAYSCAISGSGSTVIALADKNEGEIAEMMRDVFQRRGIKSRSVITGISSRGAYVEEAGVDNQ